MTELTPIVARRILDQLAGPGQPPEVGLDLITAGLEPYLSVIENDYLSSYIAEGGSSFKLVVGVYGGGKTHLLYCVRERAWNQGYATAYVALSPSECPFHRLEDVYRAIARALTPPLSQEELLSGVERGIVNFIRIWYQDTKRRLEAEGFSGDELDAELVNATTRLEGIESLSFARAVAAAFRALQEGRGQDFDDVCQWLTGEGYDAKVHRRHGILERIDKSTAFRMIRSLIGWVKEAGYKGLVVLLDEAERIPSMTSRQSDLLLNNLRQLIDECGHTHFRGALVLYAVPDETFLNGRTQTYEALRQRLGTVLDPAGSPYGVKIDLENSVVEPEELLVEVGTKIVSLYETVHGPLDPVDALNTVTQVAAQAAGERFGDTGYKRLFVQRLIPALRTLAAQDQLT